MNYLSMLTEDEIRYICSVISPSDTVGYFKQYPRDYAKLMPGFRPTSIKNKEQNCGILFRSRNQRFISSFIEKHISHWLDEIDAAIKKETDKGTSKELALFRTLPNYRFVDNIRIYFKLTGERYSEEFVSLISESIKAIKKAVKESEQANSKLVTKIAAVTSLESQLKSVQDEQVKANRKLSELGDEIKALKRTNADFEKSKSTVASLELIITSLKHKAKKRKNYIQQLRAELSLVKDEKQQLELKFREELAKQQEIEQIKQKEIYTPKCPKDPDEFKDYLGYNFENIGVSTTEDYYPLLKDHLSEILFEGKPIIINRSTGLSLMRCISNTLVKMPLVSTLAFSIGVTGKSIDNFLSQDKRVLCLDNFIGNYNETTLLTICERHRNKIIFLTVAYDHTLAYVPEELLTYCHYLNLNRIKAFTEGKELTEDPSIVDEEDANVNYVEPDARWSTTLKEIIEDFGVRGALPAYKSSRIADEYALCRLLAFDVLPYCTDVLKTVPFNVSERLLKYAVISGRCKYKDLFRRWFS